MLTGSSVGPRRFLRWSFTPSVVSSVRLLDKDNCDLLSRNQLEVEISVKPRPRFLSVTQISRHSSKVIGLSHCEKTLLSFVSQTNL